MITNILFSATPEQLEALRAWHLHEAAHASTIPERAQHLAHADDIHRRLLAAETRSETET